MNKLCSVQFVQRIKGSFLQKIRGSSPGTNALETVMPTDSRKSPKYTCRRTQVPHESQTLQGHPMLDTIALHAGVLRARKRLLASELHSDTHPAGEGAIGTRPQRPNPKGCTWLLGGPPFCPPCSSLPFFFELGELEGVCVESVPSVFLQQTRRLRAWPCLVLFVSRARRGSSKLAGPWAHCSARQCLRDLE